MASRYRTRPFPARSAAAILAVVLASGCATGSDAAVSGGQFEFVSPGGQTTIFYDPPDQRGAVTGLSGESLLEPGRTLGVEDYPDTVIVINIWGSWCGPCRAEMPALERVAQRTQEQGVQFLGVNIRDQSRSAAEDFVRDRNISYPSLYDPPGRTLLGLRGYPRNVVPSTLVLDRRHRVAAIFLKALLETDLLPVVERVAAEPVS